MSRVLATFSGRFGDILWSFPTVRELSRKHSEPVDFAIMPQYKSLLPLLDSQSYIEKAIALDDWECVGSPCGDQPWQPPVKYEQGYEHVYHLTYRQHPGMGCPALPLVDFIAWQQNLTLRPPVVPFIETKHAYALPTSICYGFNEQYADLKERLLARMRECFSLPLINVAELPWVEAAKKINYAGIFIGCRSACWVIAMGVGAETFTYEPNLSRNAYGPWGKGFGSSYGHETALSLQVTPEQGAEFIAKSILAIVAGRSASNML